MFRKDTFEAILPEIVSAIQMVQVNYGTILRYNNDTHRLLMNAEELLPQSGPKHEWLQRWVGDYSLYALVMGEFEDLIDGAARFDLSLGEVSALSLFSPLSAAEVANLIIDRLNALPRRYRVLMPLPTSITSLFDDQIGNEFDITDGIGLTQQPDEIRGLVAKRLSKSGGGNGGLLGLIQEAVPLPIYPAMVFEVSGYIPLNRHTATVDELHRRYQSFIGLCLALGIFELGNERPEDETIELMMEFQDITDPDGGRVSFRKLLDGDQGIVHRLKISQNLDRDTIVARLTLVGRVLSESERHDKFMKAGRWFYQSMSGDDQIMSFLQATIVLETLLGEKSSGAEAPSLTSLMANRCGYLLGGSAVEREHIIASFKEIYKVRSNIVHSGMNTLVHRQKIVKVSLNSLCRKVISKELAITMR